MEKDGQNNETIEYTTMINKLMTNGIREYKPLVISCKVCYFYDLNDLIFKSLFKYWDYFRVVEV